MCDFVFSVLKKATLVSDSICKHVKGLKGCTLQAYSGACISDIIYNIKNGVTIVNFDVIIVHVGTNDIHTLNLSEFSFRLHKLISLIRHFNFSSKLIFSAILPRPVDYFHSKYLVISFNNELQRICKQRNVLFVATFRPFLRFGEPICALFSPLCNLHVNHQGNLKLANFFKQVLAHAL